MMCFIRLAQPHIVINKTSIRCALWLEMGANCLQIKGAYSDVHICCLLPSCTLCSIVIGLQRKWPPRDPILSEVAHFHLTFSRCSRTPLMHRQSGSIYVIIIFFFLPIGGTWALMCTHSHLLGMPAGPWAPCDSQLWRCVRCGCSRGPV